MHIQPLKSVQIRSFFWSVFSPNGGKYGPEKNSVFGHFSCSELIVFYPCAVDILMIRQSYINSDRVISIPTYRESLLDEELNDLDQ